MIFITAGVGENLGVGAWAQVTKMKQFGTFMTNCHPIVEELAASVKNHEVSSIAFATSVVRGLRRTLEEITGVLDDA